MLSACSEPTAVGAKVFATASADADAQLAAVDALSATAADAAVADAAPAPDAAPDAGAVSPIYACPVAGSGPAPAIFADQQNGPTAVAVAGNYVYWTATNGLFRRTLSMGPIETLDTSKGSSGALAVDGGTVFFAHPNIGQVLKVAATGGTAQVLTTASTIGDVQVDDARVWFSVVLDNGYVGWLPKQGGAVTQLAKDLAFPQGIALGQDVLAWTTAGGDGKGTKGQLWYGGKDGLGIAPIVGDSNGAGPIAMRGGKVFWGEGSKLRTIAIDQSGNQTLAEAVGGIHAVATTDSEVVFSAGGLMTGSIGRVGQKGGPVTWLATHEKEPRGLAIAQGCVFWAEFGSGTANASGRIRVRDLAATAPGVPGPCTTANPAGCFGRPKDFCQPTATGQITKCVQNGGQEGCFPYQCTCDTQTATWACDSSCGGGVCKPICETVAPTAFCCQNGQYAKPDCNNAVFSCPAGTLGKPFAGCGPFSGAKNPFVTCDKYPCETGAYCCYSIVPNCSKTLSPCYAIQHCEGSHHCGAGQACCASNVTSGTYIATECKEASACTGDPNWRACAGDADCPGGQKCCAKAKDGHFGICLAGGCG